MIYLNKWLVATTFSVLLLVPVGSQEVFAEPGNTGVTLNALDANFASLIPTDPDGLDNVQVIRTGADPFGGTLNCDTVSSFGASPHFLPWTFTLTDCQTPGDVTVWSIDLSGVITCIEGSCLPLVGGELIPLDTTSLIVAGAQMNASWMIPVIVSGIGIAIVIARKF